MHPETVDRNEYYFVEPKFNNITDVLRFRIRNGESCVWPISHFENEVEKICFIQLEAEREKKFNLEIDRKPLELLALLQTSMIHKLIN